MESVKETVKMYATRRIGENVPNSQLTYFIDVAKEWLWEEEEIVEILILPLPSSYVSD